MGERHRSNQSSYKLYQLLSKKVQEKDSKTEELLQANKELAFQNKEKEKRAAELDEANKELAYQNREKENRAAELSIANKELAYQNDEKGKRAAELHIANKELAYQNREKEKRALELGIANQELEHAEEYLKAHIKGLEEIIFIISHKMRQPVGNIMGLSDLVEQHLNIPKDLKDTIKYMRKSALDLDLFTKELTTHLENMEQRGKSNF